MATNEGFINMQEDSLVLNQPTVTTTPTPRPIQVTTSDPNDPNIGLPTGPDPTGFVPYPTTQTPEGYVNPREQFPYSGFGSGSGKYTRKNYLTAPSTESSQSSDSQATNQLITNVENAFLIDKGKEIDAKQLETDLNLKLDQGIQTYDSDDIITDEDYASFVDNFGQDEADRLGIQAGQSWTSNLETSDLFKQSFEVEYDNLTGKRTIYRKFTSVNPETGGPNQIMYKGKHYTVKEIIDGYNAGDKALTEVYNNTKSFIETGSIEGAPRNLYTKDGKTRMTGMGPMTDAEYQEWLNKNIVQGEQALNWGQRISKDIKDWWSSEVDVKLIGLKNPDGTPMEGSFKVGDLVQDVAFGAALGFLTGDEEDALVGAGGQVASSYVNEMVTGIKTAASNGTIDWTPDQINHFEAGMHSLVAMGVSALQGGSAEDVAMVGAQSYATIYGAEELGKLMGLEGGPAGAATPVGGGTIAAMFAVLQGGGVKEAGLAFASGAAWAANPVLGAFVTAAQYLAGDLLYPEMSNDAGYTNLNFSDMQTTSFSQGDYDPKKSAPEFVEFTELFMQPVHEAAQDLMEEYGITFEGDFQVEFGRTDGLQIAFWDKDITGFLDRGGYDQETGDIDSKLDPRRRFESTPEGIARAQEYIIGLLTWGAKNGITKVTEIAVALEKAGRANTIEALQPAVSEYGITADDNLLDTIFSVGARQGGKISLDKGGNVQYNKGNYGLVNEKGKAPPSARADDVPMSLKEGDYVLSQPAVALYGEDTVNRMLSRAATKAGKNLKAGGKVPVNVHNGEYIIPKNLTEYIGPNVLETMNNRGLMSVGERPNTQLTATCESNPVSLITEWATFTEKVKPPMR